MICNYVKDVTRHADVQPMPPFVCSAAVMRALPLDASFNAQHVAISREHPVHLKEVFVSRNLFSSSTPTLLPYLQFIGGAYA